MSSEKPVVIAGGWTPEETWEDLQKILAEKDIYRAVELRKSWTERYVIDGNQVVLRPERIRELMFERGWESMPGGYLLTPRGLFDCIEVLAVRPGGVVTVGSKGVIELNGRIWVLEMQEAKEEETQELTLSEMAEIWEAGRVAGWSDCERGVTIVAGYRTPNPYSMKENGNPWPTLRTAADGQR